MARSVNVFLKMKDQFTEPMKKATKSTKTMQRAMKKSRNSVKRFGEQTKKTMKKVVKATAVATTALGGLALKTGFEQAFDMEGYRVQLETATKDTQKASKLMQKAVKFANKTPFETGEVVEATANMEMYGMSSTKWLGDIADMAGATNKSMSQATEAMVDATVGEWERLLISLAM